MAKVTAEDNLLMAGFQTTIPMAMIHHGMIQTF